MDNQTHQQLLAEIRKLTATGADDEALKRKLSELSNIKDPQLLDGIIKEARRHA